jgi:hypothetical protein
MSIIIEPIMCFLVGMEFWALVNWKKHQDKLNAQIVVSNGIALMMCLTAILL